MNELNGRRCPIGARDFNGQVRHCIDFSWFQEPYNVPSELERFNQFIHNTKKKRISFLTSNNSGCIEMNPKIIFSVDKTNIDEFNRIVINANSHLDWTTALKNPRQVSYDFVDLDSDEANLYAFYIRWQAMINNTGKKITDAGNNFADGIPIIGYIAIGLGLKYLWDNTNKPRGKK